MDPVHDDRTTLFCGKLEESGGRGPGDVKKFVRLSAALRSGQRSSLGLSREEQERVFSFSLSERISFYSLLRCGIVADTRL